MATGPADLPDRLKPVVKRDNAKTGAPWERAGILEALKKERNPDGTRAACDFCGRELKVRPDKLHWNGGQVPLGGRARPDGIHTVEWLNREAEQLQVVPLDILVLIIYCWHCNRIRPGEKLCRVDRAIRSVGKGWAFEDYLNAPGDLGAAMRNAYEHGRRLEYAPDRRIYP